MWFFVLSLVLIGVLWFEVMEFFLLVVVVGLVFIGEVGNRFKNWSFCW